MYIYLYLSYVQLSHVSIYILHIYSVTYVCTCGMYVVYLRCIYIYIHIQRCMYTCIYMLARCIYTGIEPLVWRVCVHVSHVSCESCLSLSLSRARALSLSLSLSQKVLYCGAALCTFESVHASVGP